MKYQIFSCPGSSLPVHSLPFGLFTVQLESSLGGGEGGLTMALQSTTIHQYNWLVKASSHHIAVIATDNTTVVACIKKKGGIKSGPLCALLWRILTWFSRKQVTSLTHSSRLNVIADKLSSLSQTRQSRQNGPSCQSFFQTTCFWWHQPQVACFLPPDSTTNCLNLYHQGQTPNMDNDAVCRGRIWTHMPSHW